MAVAILLIIVLLFGQIVAIMSKAWTFGRGRANNFTKARAMMELLAEDIQGGVFRADLPAFPVSGSTPDTSLWEFYTARPGIPASGTAASALRNVSVVQYSFIGPSNPGGIPNTVERADSPILWTDQATNPPFGNLTTFAGSPTPRDTAPGVVAFQIVFIQSDGTFSTKFTPLSTAGVANTNPTRGLSVSLAVVDDDTLQRLSQSSNNLLTKLNTALTASVTDSPPQHSIKSYWDSYLNGTSMNWTSYPAGTGSGLATFERYVTLPNAP